VLLGHGTSALIRAGGSCRQVPLDRANSILELIHGGFADRSGTQQRIRAAYYDRIFLNAEDWYGEVRGTIETRYKKVGEIPAASQQSSATGREGLDWDFGYQHIMNSGVQILIPRR
jgi:hypothetical protein